MWLPAIGKGLLAAFIYLIPAVSLHLLVRSLRDPARETWEIPDAALGPKRAYHRWSGHGLHLLSLLNAAFVLHVTMFVTLAGATACQDTQTSHLSAVAHNVSQVTDMVFLAGFAVLVAALIAGAIFAWTYLLHARRQSWPDPRRRDVVVVHTVILPLAAFLLFAAFASVGPLICG